MPGVTEEVISHFGQMFPYREVEHAALPAPVSARMFLRHIRTTGAAVTDWKELLEVLGLLHMLSCKQHQFRAPTTAAAISPPSELLVEVRQTEGKRGWSCCWVITLCLSQCVSAAS